MKKFLQALITRKKTELKITESRFDKSTDETEIRALGETLAALRDEISDAEEKLKELEKEGPKEGEEGENKDDSSQDDPAGTEDKRSFKTGTDTRDLTPLAAYGQRANEPKKSESVLDSMEYRQAFAKYVRTGDTSGFADIEKRADEMLTTAEVGKVIPNIIMNEIIKELKSYGNLYNRVRKLNVRGGVEFPIEELVPTISWIAETETSGTQKKPEIKTSVVFGYYIAEARISQSLLSQVTSLPVLESEIAKLLAEAFVKEFDRVILNGSGKGQPTGILNDTRIKKANKIQINAEEAVDWTKWREKLFSKVPLSYRAGGVLIMTVDTWESLICTMKDANNRPLYSETYDVNTGDAIYRFNGKEVLLVENDLGIADYSTAAEGDVYMVYAKLENYAINSNMQLAVKRYYNEDTNKWINKGIVIMDGKLLDTNGVFLVNL